MPLLLLLPQSLLPLLLLLLLLLWLLLQPSPPCRSHHIEHDVRDCALGARNVPQTYQRENVPLSMPRHVLPWGIQEM